jgi:ribokinase
MNKRNILVVGSANIDLVARVSRIPKPGETLMGHSFTTVCGGKGANQALAAARLGASVAFLGCMGADAFAAQQRESLAGAGVCLDYLKVVEHQPTGTAIIEVSDEGENSIVVVPGANFELTPADIRERRGAFEAADVVLLQLEVPVETVEAALHLAKECGVLSILDIGSDQAITPEVLGKASVISPNRSEAEGLTGLPVDSSAEVLVAAKALLDYGADHVVMKLGAAGSHYVGSDSDQFAPAFSVDVVDTTAAGDAFTAALGVRWNERNVAEVLRYANAVGALTTTKAGAQPSLPDKEEVAAFLAR